MSRLFILLCLLMATSQGVSADELPVTASQVAAAIEQTLASTDPSDPAREALLKSYRDTSGLLQEIVDQKAKMDAYTIARETAYTEAQGLKSELQASLDQQVAAPDRSLGLAEMEQLIQVDKSNLSVLQNRLVGIGEELDDESDRAAAIRQRLEELGADEPDLAANLKLVNKSAASGSKDEALWWLAEVQYASNRAEKGRLDEELLSQPMRLELLSAQRDKFTHDASVLEAHLLAMEKRAGELRQGEADAALAAAETAQADASGKHALVRQLADENALLSAEIADRGSAIAGFRARELESGSLAEQFERDLSTIERKLEILGMNKTVGEILREQAVYLPGEKMIARELISIADLIGHSGLRQMELQEQRRTLVDIQGFVDGRLVDQSAGEAQQLQDDMMQLALNRRELVGRAIELEATYARALTDLDFAVHRLDDAVDGYRVFISERLLLVQSRDPISWSLFTELPQQLAESFAPAKWLQVIRWVGLELMARPLILLLLLVVAALVWLTPRVQQRLIATGHSVGFVRRDAFSETLKALAYTGILMLKWPLLLAVLSMPLAYHEDDSGLVVALQTSLVRTALYFLGLEFIRCLLLPRGLVEAHFRWPTSRVVELHKRIVRFEQTFLPTAFFGSLFLGLYPTEVGGAGGTIAVIALLLSVTHLFHRMPHFVKDKMDQFFAEPKAHIHHFWGNLVRGLLSWTPLAMIIAVFFGYIYTAIEYTMLLMQTVVLFTGMLLIHELGMRWLRITRRKLRLKVQEELAQAHTGDEGEQTVEEDILEQDPDLFDDEGTKFLNGLLLLGSILGLAVIWSEVFPALGILDSVELWQRTESVNGEDLIVQVTLSDVIAALFIGFLGWIALRRLPNLLEILLRQRMDVGAASAYAVATVLKYTLTAVVVIAVLSMLGGSWSQIQWAVAALSLGIGFGLQEIVANFFSGLIILFEQPIRVGDTVTVGETSGVVTKIQMRATTIRDWDRRELLVPNKEFVTARLLNWSLTDPITRIHIEVGVAYGSDMDAALEIIRQSAVDHPLILDDPAPFVTFDNFGDNSLAISLRCYLEELDKRLSTASAIRLDINRRLIEAGIEVAFPQRDVHLDARGPLDIRLVDPRLNQPG